MSTEPILHSAAPFFIVADIQASVAFYRDQLGFSVRLLIPDESPFFAVVRRGPVTILLKEIGPDTAPLPNFVRHDWARWDVLIYTADPDALFAEFQAKGLAFHSALADTHDGLRAFEIQDNSGYVLCFAWPLDDSPA